MGSRPTDWSPLRDSDPTPGDPDEIKDLGDRYLKVADTIEQQIGYLKRVRTDDFWSGQAAKAFSERREKTEKKLELVKERYHRAGKALTQYYPKLAQAQSEADKALTDAKQAQTQANQSQTQLTQVQDANRKAQQHNQANPNEPAQPVDSAGAATQQHTLDDANEALRTARKNLQTAEDHYRDAARQCATEIDHAAHDKLKNDTSLWGDFKRVVHKVVTSKVFKAVQAFVATAATLVGIASVFLGWIPVFGQALDLLALGLGAAALVMDTLEAIDTGDWTAAGLDALSLATFGAGRMLGAAKEAAMAGRAAEEASSASRAAGDALDMAADSRAAQFLKTSNGRRLAQLVDEDGKPLQGLNSAERKEAENLLKTKRDFVDSGDDVISKDHAYTQAKQTATDSADKALDKAGKWKTAATPKNIVKDYQEAKQEGTPAGAAWRDLKDTGAGRNGTAAQAYLGGQITSNAASLGSAGVGTSLTYQADYREFVLDSSFQHTADGITPAGVSQ